LRPNAPSRSKTPST